MIDQRTKEISSEITKSNDRVFGLQMELYSIIKDKVGFGKTCLCGNCSVFYFSEQFSNKIGRKYCLNCGGNCY